MQTQPIHPAVRIGHVHLRVADLDRAITLYRNLLGFGLTADGRQAGIDAAFLAAGDYHHHIGLNTWESAGGTLPPPGHTDLYRVAFLYTMAPTTAPTCRCTSPTPTATGSSSTTTAPASSGSTPTAARSSRPSASTPPFSPHRHLETEHHGSTPNRA